MEHIKPVRPRIGVCGHEVLGLERRRRDVIVAGGKVGEKLLRRVEDVPKDARPGDLAGGGGEVGGIELELDHVLGVEAVTRSGRPFHWYCGEYFPSQLIAGGRWLRRRGRDVPLEVGQRGHERAADGDKDPVLVERVHPHCGRRVGECKGGGGRRCGLRGRRHRGGPPHALWEERASGGCSRRAGKEKKSHRSKAAAAASSSGRRDGSEPPIRCATQVATWSGKPALCSRRARARARARLTYGPPCSSPQLVRARGAPGGLGTHPEAAPGEAPNLAPSRERLELDSVLLIRTRFSLTHHAIQYYLLERDSVVLLIRTRFSFT